MMRVWCFEWRLLFTESVITVWASPEHWQVHRTDSSQEKREDEWPNEPPSDFHYHIQSPTNKQNSSNPSYNNIIWFDNREGKERNKWCQLSTFQHLLHFPHPPLTSFLPLLPLSISLSPHHPISSLLGSRLPVEECLICLLLKRTIFCLPKRSYKRSAPEIGRDLISNRKCAWDWNQTQPSAPEVLMLSFAILRLVQALHVSWTAKQLISFCSIAKEAIGRTADHFEDKPWLHLLAASAGCWSDTERLRPASNTYISCVRGWTWGKPAFLLP